MLHSVGIGRIQYRMVRSERHPFNNFHQRKEKGKVKKVRKTDFRIFTLIHIEKLEQHTDNVIIRKSFNLCYKNCEYESYIPFLNNQKLMSVIVFID